MFLYVLYSDEFKRHYIGITQNIQKRLIQHNSGGVSSTKAYRPWIVLYTEEHKSKEEARIRELFLKKNGRSRQELFTKIHMAPSSSASGRILLREETVRTSP